MIRPLLPRFRRLFSTETLQSPPTIQRGFSFGRVLFGSIILSTASVAGAVVFSAENPEFHSLLVTNIPEPAMEWLVKGQKQYIQLKSSVSGSRNNQEEKSPKPPGKPVKVVKTPKNAVGTEQPPKIEFKSVEEVVLHFNRALGRLALITKQLDAGDKDEEKRQSIEREIKAIAEHLHQNVPAIQTQIDAQLAELSAKSQTALSEQSSQFAQLLQAESARIADSLTRELEAKHEQEKLMIIQNGEQSAQQRLSELEDRLHQSHQADLTVQAEQLQKQFDQRVQQLVDEERQGRLARLELLSAKLDLLERLTRSYVEAYGQASRLHRVWTAYFLARGAVESNDPQQLRSLRRHWTLLQELGKDEPLIETVLASIQSAVLDQGVPAMSELRAQFESLEGKLHQVGLAPEDGGLFELSIAYLFSLLRFRNVDSGGNDVESIVTRTKYYLKNGDLSSATREMNSLDGWSRRLARDFLERCRRRLEVQQALDAVEAHLGQQTLSTAALLSPATSS